MTMTTAMAAALTALTEALDDPETDIAQSLQRLTLDAAAAVASYRGLSVLVPYGDPPLNITMLADGAVAKDVRTSLRFRMSERDHQKKSLAVAIILYAGSPGAFVDLAADLAWLTARSPEDFVLDEHVAFAAEPVHDGHLHAASAINQAVGVLIGRGYTPQQADWQLDTQAANNRTDRHAAAKHILDRIPAGDYRGPFDTL